MLYLFPFFKSVTVEYRKYGDDAGRPNRIAWRIRNLSWGRWIPTLAYFAERFIPIRSVRYIIIGGINRSTQLALKWIVRSSNTIATDQMIRYPDASGIGKYTFSIWAFPEEDYTQRLREYFDFCQRHYRETGFRCNMLNVGYRISEDRSSLFSYSFDGPVMTLDPVSSGAAGWDAFLVAYNQFCSERGGVPLFNQTKWVTSEQARLAFGDRLQTFGSYRRQFDPEERLLNEYFKEILA